MKTCKRPGKGWRPEKPGTKVVGEKKEVEQVERREKEHSDVLSRMDFLGNPFDEMNIDEKKKHALYLFYDIIKVCNIILNKNKNQTISCFFQCFYIIDQFIILTEC